MTTFTRPVQNQVNGNTYVEIRNSDGTPASFGYTVTDDSNMPATPLFTPVGGEYRATPTTYADGDATVLQSDYRGYLLTVLGDKIAGEDTDNDWINVSLATKLQALLSGTENDSLMALPGRRTDSFQASMTSADATSAASIQALSSGKSIYITDIVISTDTAMNIKIQDSAGTPVVLIGPLYLPASSTYSKTFDTPLKTTISKALNVIASLAGNISVSVSGYII